MLYGCLEVIEEKIHGYTFGTIITAIARGTVKRVRGNLVDTIGHIAHILIDFESHAVGLGTRELAESAMDRGQSWGVCPSVAIGVGEVWVDKKVCHVNTRSTGLTDEDG